MCIRDSVNAVCKTLEAEFLLVFLCRNIYGDFDVGRARSKDKAAQLPVGGCGVGLPSLLSPDAFEFGVYRLYGELCDMRGGYDFDGVGLRVRGVWQPQGGVGRTILEHCGLFDNLHAYDSVRFVALGQHICDGARNFGDVLHGENEEIADSGICRAHFPAPPFGTIVLAKFFAGG